MFPDHPAQVVPVGFHVFPRNTLDLNQFVDVLVHKGVIQVQYVSEATGHTGAKVITGSTQDGHQAAGHIFTAVIASTFNNGVGTGITNGESLTGSPRSKQLATGSAIKTGIANDRRFLCLEVAAPWWLDHQ